MGYQQKQEFIQQRYNREEIKADLWTRWKMVTELFSDFYNKYMRYINAKFENKDEAEIYKTEYSKIFLLYFREAKSFWELVKHHINPTMEFKIEDKAKVKASEYIEELFIKTSNLKSFSELELLNNLIGQATKDFFDLSDQTRLRPNTTYTQKRKKPEIFK